MYHLFGLIGSGILLFSSSVAFSADFRLNKALNSVVTNAPVKEVRSQASSPAVPNVAEPAAAAAAAAASPTPAPVSPADTVAKPVPAPPVLTIQKVPFGRVFLSNVDTEQEAVLTQAAKESVKGIEPTAAPVVVPGLLRVQAANGEELRLKAVILVGQPLVYLPDKESFEGSIKVGVTALNDNIESRNLSAPVPFEVLESRMAATPTAEVRSLSPPFAEIVIRAKTLGSTVTVHVSSAYEPQGVPIALPVEPALVLRTQRSQFQGFGLETTPITVSLLGAENVKGREISFTADPSAFFEPEKVSLDDHGNATVFMRSDGTGEVTIRASSGGLQSGARTVTFMWPVATLSAGVTGGVGGGLIRLLSRSRRQLSVGRFLAALAVAILVGLLVFVLYALGINVLSLHPTVRTGAILVLGVAALGAFVGAGSLSAVTGARARD